MAYATITDYEMRNGTVDPEHVQLVETLLGDAATMLDGMVEVDEGDAHQAEVLKIVSCNMVSRRMEADLSGVDQMSYTMGPFAQSAHFVSPGGDMWLTKGEKRMLGIGGFAVGTIRPWVRGGFRACP